MTDLTTLPHTFKLHNPSPKQLIALASLDTDNPPPSRLGAIMVAIAMRKATRLQAMRLIIRNRDIKIAQIEQRQTHVREQQDGAAKCAIRPLSRWYEGIKDPAVAAVYKSSLQLIRRLTRGKR